MRSIPTVNGGGEPSGITTDPFTMTGYVSAFAIGAEHNRTPAMAIPK
jgi:hypothetical protein